MLKKRLAVIVACALMATLPPMVFQYVIEPRMDGANVDIEILGILYDGDASSNESTAFSVALKLTNDAENDAIMSPLDLDVYYRSSDTNRYRMIGKMTTNKDYNIPGKSSVDKGDAEENFLASVVDGADIVREDRNERKGYNTGDEIKGTLYFYKKGKGQTFYESANEALIDLINDGQIDLKFSGNALFGPVSIPIETPDIDLKATIWDPELVLRDVFLLDDGSGPNPKQFVLHTKMRNPSGLPINIQSFDLSLINETGTVVGDPLEMEDILESYDPDQGDQRLDKLFLDGSTYTFESAERFAWEDVFFGFEFSNEQNLGWFISKLMDEPVLSGFTLKGPAEIFLGKGLEKSFKVDMTEEEDYLTLQNVNFYQKYIDKYPGRASFTGQEPLTMLGNFTIGEIQANKMIVNTETNEMTIDMFADMALTNSYRFEYSVDNFNMSFIHKNSGGKLAKSAIPTSYTVARAYRDVGGEDPLKIITRTTDIPVNLTTTYNTGDQNAGVYKLFEDLDNPADNLDLPDLLNLTNPFYIEPGTEAYENNPLTTIEFLIQQNINPLTLLNEVDLTHHIESYRPLKASHFGSQDRDLLTEDISTQASSETAMPYCGTDTDFPVAYHDENNYFCELGSEGSDWTEYYNNYQSDKRGPNQYAVFQNPFADSYFPDDSDITGSYDLIGGICDDDSTRTGSYDSTPISDFIWRVYSSSIVAESWGFDYDDLYGERGYYAGMYTSNPLMFSQNFTIDPNTYNEDPDNIEEVTLSISYKYLDAAHPNEAFLLFSWFDDVSGQYDYSLTSDNNAFGRNGWVLQNPGNNEWDTFTVDLTSEFITQLETYELSGDPDDLKGEISFSGESGSTFAALFDDIVLNIKYKNDISDHTSALTLEDFFGVLEEIDPTVGNMYSVLNETLTEEERSEFWRYLAQDESIIEEGPTNTEGMDFFQYLQYSNVSLSVITDILQNKYKELNIGEPANFLEMLTNSKYRLVNDNDNSGDIIYTPYGPRVSLEEELDDYYWTIEDPYAASRALMDALEANIYPSGSYHQGQELWHLMENLGVTMPWVVMYLMTHGWTKNQVFDALEALGLGSEVHTLYDSDRDYGTMDVDVRIKALTTVGWFGSHEISERNIPIDIDLNPVLSDGTQALFSAVSHPQPGGTDLVHNSGTIGDTYYFQETGTFTVLWVDFDVDTEIWVYLDDYELIIGVNPDSTKLCPTPDENDDSQDSAAGDYLEGTSFPYGNGLNLAGTREFASNLRINYKFTGDPFISTGGDPTSMFQFLDDNYFYKKNGVDYTSFQLLNRFGVSSQDFIDIITGYNPTTGTHDENMNGKADDWYAPSDYYTREGLNLPDPSSLEGWGNNYIDNALYWGPDNPSNGQIDGAVIWSNSPDLITSSNGFISSGMDIAEGAPPVVDLFDMLAWISEASGSPDPNELFAWLLGELPPEAYQYIDVRNGNLLSNTEGYNRGLNNEKVWRMLREASFNATGFFDWMERTKNINSFTFLSKLDEATDKVDALDLLYFATNPNLIRYSDGALSFLFHDGLDGQYSTDANDYLWNFFNVENSVVTLATIRGIFQYLESVGFNTFDIFNALGVSAASWLAVINNNYGISPIEVIKKIKRGTYTGDYINPGIDYAPNAASIFSISANMTFTYSGTVIPVDTDLDISETTLYGSVHFRNFISSSVLQGSNFIII